MEQAAKRRAVVTGIGVIAPVGLDRGAFLEAVLAATPGIDRIRAFDTAPFRTPFGGELPSFDPRSRLSREEIELLDDRYLQMALFTARQALEDAGLRWSRETPPGPRAGLAVGTCNGGLLTAQRQYRFLLGLEEGRLDRKMNLLIRYHTAGKALSHCLGIGGPTWVVSTACSSSTCALGLAWELIADGQVDVVLAGGADALCMATMAGFDSIKATSTGLTAPFSLPVGLNLGEGAAFWVVEEASYASRRGARVEGEILGYSFTADGYHPTAPDPRGDGQWRTMSQAVERAGATVDELGCINLHGTGTEANDRVESKAVRRLIEERAIPAYSFKSQVGHCLGAAGILEASAGLLAMNRGVIPATINFGEARPGCDLDYVPNAPREASYDCFLSCNYAFGGHNAAVVLGTEHPRYAAREARTRAVITGCGAVTSLGLGAAPLLAALEERKRGIVEAADRVRGDPISRMGGFVPPFSAKDIDRRLDLKAMNPLSRLATAAARLTLDGANQRFGPKEGLDTGVINGVHAGTSEEDYMLAVVRSGGAEADIGSFSSMVPNATGGWISTALLLKGYSCTVTMGADAGLFALAMARMAVSGGAAARVLAGGADELFSRYYLNCDELGLLQTGDDERDYRLRLDLPDRRVLGEGAAYVMVESRESASARRARVLAEIAGVAQTSDFERLVEGPTDHGSLAAAIAGALRAAGWDAGEVGLVCWSPQGNAGDARVLRALEAALRERAAEVPLLTTVFNTGLAEASSGMITLAALLQAWSTGIGAWPQITGVDDIDRRRGPGGPTRTLLVATSELGFNLAVALEPGEGVR